MENNQKRIEKIQFKGEAGEYFGIWFVNNMLTSITLGIYSPWAKVRNLQYFYGNTELAGGSFQFTADPMQMLRSRLIAVALFILYMVADAVGSTFGTIIVFTLVIGYFLLAPIFTVFIMSFRLRYSAWRGINFNFNKDYKGAYKVYLAPLTVILLFLGSFYLPFNSTQVEEFFGLESPYYQAEIEVDETYDSSETGDDYSDEYQGEYTQEHTDDTHYDEQYESQYYDEDLSYDDYNNEENYDEEYEDEYYDEEYYDEDYYEEEEDSYVNPYFFIPSAILFLLLLALFPYFDYINMHFLSRNVRLGTAKFNYTAAISDYYTLYAKWYLVTLILLGLWGLSFYTKASDNSSLKNLSAILFPVMTIATIIYLPFTKAYFKSRRYNLLLSNTIIDQKHKLRANVPMMKFLWIMVSNTAGIIVSFGLLTAWAKIRTARCLLDHTELEAHGSLDEFIAAQNDDNSALAEEVADVFDLDIGF